MLTRPNDSDDRGRGLIAMTYPPPPLADGDNNTQTGVFSSAPAWSSSSSSSSSSPPSFSSVTTSPSCSSLTCARSSPPAISSMPPSTLSFPSPPSSVDCPLLSLPTDSSITLFPCHPIKCNSNSSPSPSPVFLPSSSSSTPLTTRSTHPSVSSPYFSPGLSSSSSPTVSVSSSILYSPASLSYPAPVLPPVPTPCCSCSTLLPRLLSAHRLEVRRLLRGALATLSRRLDSLERRSRSNVRRKRSRQTGEEEEEEGRAPSSHEPATSPLSPSLTDEEEDEERNRKRRKKQRAISHSFKNREEDEVEKDEGRFVVRMAVSFVGEEEGAPLLLHNLNHNRRADSGSTQPERAVTLYRPNGFRTPPVLRLSFPSSSSRGPLHLMQSAHSSRSETLDLSSGRWRFSNILLPHSVVSNHRAVHQWLRSSPASYMRPTILLKLPAVAAEKILESMRGRSCASPLRPLKDWTAPPSLSTDHCYMQTLSLSSPSDVVRHQKQRNSHRLHLPQRRPQPLSPCLTNGPSAALPNGQTIPGTVVEPNKERGKRVSQIRIRRGPPRETPLTPMGLPKVKRLKKKEFSLEEIYTNKNYKSPSSNRTLETIFEEAREKDGALLRIGHQKRRRLLLFPDFTQPRKRKRPPGIGLPVASMPKKRVASRRYHGGSPVEDESDVDVMLVERLSALEDFLTQQGLDV